MYLGEDTNRMSIFCKGAGFCDMVAFFIDIFCVCTVGSVPDKAKGVKFAAAWFHDITVIDMDDGFVRDLFADGVKVGSLRFSRNAFIQMSGDPFYGIDLFGWFVELVYNVGQEAAPGSEYAVSHIGSKLFVRF